MNNYNVMRKYFDENKKYFIAIKINLEDFHNLKKITYIELLKNIFIQILLILIFSYTLKLIKIFESSKKKLEIAEEQAKLASYSKVLAHEIKNPLSSISGLVDFVKDKLDNDNLKNYLNNAKDEINRLNKIVNDFLNFGKEMQLIKKELDLTKLIEKTITFMKYEANAKKIEFELNMEHCTINADQDKIMQVLMNLILNAIESAPENSKIQILLKNNLLTIINQVTKPFDNDTDKLFNPFYSTKTVGTGLGLSISKKILDLHNFKIQIISTEPFKIQINFKGI
jgi:two-component system sensor histidine kinase HydH